MGFSRPAVLYLRYSLFWLIGFVATATTKRQALISPAYFTSGSNDTFGDVLATLAVTGLANRGESYLWLNASSTSWVNGVPVMWSYPEADATWIPYLAKSKGLEFTVAKDAKLCTLLADPRLKPALGKCN